ncbi:MAG: 2-hydroxyglutaryl-CoA dehydratase, partial [Tetragenococcus halophilus]|nr:2-hydroxyglutaryl-CoA dehydratase [Tetragenococcus halophilus]
MVLRAGIDVGSTTIKLVIIDQKQNAIFSKYERHYSDVKKATEKILRQAKEVIGEKALTMSITGSGGMSLAEVMKIPFIQEVIACTKTVEEVIPKTDVAIELGGEDAKITFFERSLEQRMNGSCAGGTGAFIDQMASLLETDANGVNELAKSHQQIYPIASRCGVFAKTDVQPLLNDGADKEDIAASIFQAVVNQTIAGLASGRKIRGKIAFLGGPLYFMSELRQRFIETLQIAKEDVIFPQDSQLYVAMGAALYSESNDLKTIDQLLDCLLNGNGQQLIPTDTLAPLFASEKELNDFQNRHQKA